MNEFIVNSILIQINGKNQHTKCLFDTHNFLLSTASLLSVARIIKTKLYPTIEPYYRIIRTFYRTLLVFVN